MSDLAPLVSAAIRDKVVSDLQEERNNLKRKVEELTKSLNSMQTIEISGKSTEGKKIVYSTGQVDRDGVQCSCTSVPHWQVYLESLITCPCSQIDGTLELS